MTLFKLQRYSAVALLVFLTIHMIVVHYPPFHIDFSRIITRMEQPAWKAIDILFLASVLVHALAGSYAVITDLGRMARFRRPIAILITVMFVILFAWGSLTVLNFQRPAGVASLTP